MVDGESHVFSVPRKDGEDDDIYHEHNEDVVKGEAVLALTRSVTSHSLQVQSSENVVA